jgi:aconitate decarboxylase
LTREQHLAKFRRCLEFAATPLPPGTADRLIDAADRLDEIEDVRRLAMLAVGVLS